MVKFVIERDSSTPVTVTVDQISERFMDKARNGGYKPAQTRLIITKLSTRIDEKTHDVVYQQTFMGGEKRQESHCTAVFIQGL